MLKILACFIWFTCLGTAHAGSATVAAAATLRHALDEISPQFTKATGHTLKVAYGSSGNFYSQIKQGAPFDVFLSADMVFPQKLVDEKLAVAPALPYAEGRLVLLLPRKSRLKPDGTLADLAAALKDGRLSKLAIANPTVAPYGTRAQEALMHADLWAGVKPRLVIGENVGQATQFVASGAAQAGLVALSLALAPDLAARTQYALVPREWHQPLVQGMVLIQPENPAAKALADYLKTETARAVLKKYGYDEVRGR
ncbi:MULTISPECIES: molybdate ABC transporter substrate-binding protein [unclassified Limnobacter]|uniref:molybdate ABC transporter substrate-binding protein n=1 Tax=unclassified Limnobacter TaxID=2630203 RepID=UPI000156CBB0|nr:MULTISPECIES: molybdate ABC transporter substrate-binding protein [unclassified Limnobacter]EDM82878.1 molybdenum ABC transporter, periplasmic molybdate-binding protein [Limnobacter sp. MED105]MAZ10446.1 molybdate ABC transporter substrate-binding protein [Sutterellaceae bacterium]